MQLQRLHFTMVTILVWCGLGMPHLPPDKSAVIKVARLFASLLPVMVQGIVGFAAGAAASGYTPVAEIQFAGGLVRLAVK